MGCGNLMFVCSRVMDNYSQFLFQVVTFYKATTDTELRNTEPLLLLEIED